MLLRQTVKCNKYTDASRSSVLLSGIQSISVGVTIYASLHALLNYAPIGDSNVVSLFKTYFFYIMVCDFVLSLLLYKFYNKEEKVNIVPKPSNDIHIPLYVPSVDIPPLENVQTVQSISPPKNVALNPLIPPSDALRPSMLPSDALRPSMLPSDALRPSVLPSEDKSKIVIPPIIPPKNNVEQEEQKKKEKKKKKKKKESESSKKLQQKIYDEEEEEVEKIVQKTIKK